MEITPAIYNKGLYSDWNNFVASSKNSTFLFYRDFVEYHKDRITDFSLLFLKKNKIVALLPANRGNDSTLYSHQGLTYGGIITDKSMTTALMLDIFGSLRLFLTTEGFKQFIYKPIPHIYHQFPAEEDLYALFRNKGELISRNISSCIYNGASINYTELRKRGIKKALNIGLSISESNNFTMFWQVLEENLMKRHSVKPVHTLSEIEYLKSKFDNEIRLFEVNYQGKVIAGCVTFESVQVIHAQYISASDEGRQLGALDLLFDYLITRAKTLNKHFDFGTSTEQGGNILNEGLISQKEGFGARGIVYDTYKIQL
ncbi:GNAT family N-acetyltransferase [Dysgonomonas macrotermitis]|uniref:Acetyltransferase (GNAT) domain-containing protein n=1 Tax=Dysgonomonas macrotermitis TaxID=1346286 RepID=A0A1M5C834_9BACT|nr:GNAT family N-acetyltransferase [Dysgonomonas macrotermitis]SHF50820.1 Acetyltransferase (GNAT) domain-containing protein [Dysgonomonas macrotermitis]